MEKMRLTIPANANWTLVLRMATAAISAIYELPCGTVEDLSAAIDESCDLLLHQKRCIEALTLVVSEQADGIHMDLESRPCSEGRTQECVMDENVSKMFLECLVRGVKMLANGPCVQQVSMLLPDSVKNYGRK